MRGENQATGIYYLRMTKRSSTSAPGPTILTWRSRSSAVSSLSGFSRPFLYSGAFFLSWSGWFPSHVPGLGLGPTALLRFQRIGPATVESRSNEPTSFTSLCSYFVYVRGSRSRLFRLRQRISFPSVTRVNGWMVGFFLDGAPFS
jgi:hypothetical protein